MKKILLTQGQYAIVDDKDFDRVSKYRWYARWSKDIKSYYACRNIQVGKHQKGSNRWGQKNLLMHTLIMSTPKGMATDHINHDTLDNRRSNLRICTHGENQWNRKDRVLEATGTTKTKSGKFQAQARGKYLGIFDTMNEAHQAYLDEWDKRSITP